MRPVLVLALTLPMAATAATYTVGPTGDHATLQAAVDAAVEGDVLQIQAVSVSGAAVVDRSLTIEGLDSAASQLTAPTTVLQVLPGVALTVRDLTLTGGGGRALSATDAAVTLDGVTVEDGTDVVGGGGVHVVGGALSVTGSTLRDNRSASGFGGHILAEDADLQVTGSHFEGGRAERGGAVMVLGGQAAVSSSSFTKNGVRADENRGVGGAIATEFASLTISGSEFLDNVANDGQGGHISVYRGDGFVIEDSTVTGVADKPAATRFFGGGIVVFDAETLVRNVAFSDLLVEHSGEDGSYGYGGALFIFGTLDLPFLIEGSTFTDNRATGYGGAVRVESGSGTVRTSQFTGNEGDYGGGLHVATSESVLVEDSEFRDNRARYGAALRWIPPQPGEDRYAGELTLRNNTYVDNASDNYGGVMYARNGARLVLDGDTATGNTGTLGGAHMLYSVQQIEVRRGVYCQNRAEGGPNPDGGAIASYLSGADAYIVTNNVFAENRATAWGGGMSMLRDGAATVENNTFLANRAADGGGIALRGSSGSPMSASFVNNLVAYTAGGDGVGARDVATLHVTYGAFASNLSLHLDEGLEPLDATNLIDVEPTLLAYNSDGDCGNDVPYPAFGSPLVDAGTPSLRDLDGGPSDIGASGGPSADPALWIDADQDGDIELWDCDDADPSRGPSQAEVAHDGIDQDCDGVDLLDGDGDGFDRDDDCDDDDPGAFPGAPEIANDGIDQDCDGADLLDVDDDTDDGAAGERGGCGCGAVTPAASWWLVLPMLVWIRRRSEAGTR